MKYIKTKPKHLFFYITMFIFTLTVCFVLLEFVFAQFYYSNLTSISCKEFDDTLGWRLRSGTYLVKPPHSFRKHRLYINSFGLRNKNVSTSKQKNIRRILVMGDSFTCAEHIPEAKVFTSMLERTININSNEEYEVINCGVSGYGTAQQLLFMQRLSDLGLTGDAYLLMIFTNDILDNLRLDYKTLQENSIQPGFFLHNSGRLELKHLPEKEISPHSQSFVPVTKTLKRTKIVETLKSRIESFLQTRPNLIRILNKLGFDAKFPIMPGLLNGWYREDVLDTGVPLMKAVIKEIKLKCEEGGAELLVGIIPSPIQVYPRVYGKMLKGTFPNNPQVQTFLQDITRPQDKIIGICQELQVPFLDLYPILYENNDKVLFIPKDGHFNEAGHALVAESLAEFVMQNIR